MVLRDDAPRIRELIAVGENPNEKDPSSLQTPLSTAIVRGKAEVVETLLTHGADPNLGPKGLAGTTPLTMAIVQGRADLVALLFRHEADPNQTGPPPDLTSPLTKTATKKS